MAEIKPALIIHSSRQVDPNVLLDSDIAKYVLKIPDIPDYQNFVKNRLGHLADTTIILAAGEITLRSIIFDGTFLWVGLGTSPAKILKLNPSDNTYTVINAKAEQDDCKALAFDSRNLFIWAGLGTSPAIILKINSSTNIIESAITAGIGQNDIRSLVHDGTYVWAGLNTSPAIFLKINPLTDSIDSVITAADTDNQCRGLAFDGIFIWAGLNTTPAKILKINPATDTIVTTIPAVGTGCRSITFDGSFIWVGITLGALNGSRLLKIDPSNNTIVETLTSTGMDFPDSILFDGTFIWIAGEFAEI